MTSRPGGGSHGIAGAAIDPRHAEIGQGLTGLNILLEMSRPGSSELAGEYQADARAPVQTLLRQVRELSLDLRPAMLDDLGLLPTLAWYVERYRTRSGIQVRFTHGGLDGRRFPTEVETAAYRIVQEALTNVVRHAHVVEVTLRARAGEETLGVQIQDQGVGFDPEAALAAHGSSGLVGIRERTALLGGQVVVEWAPGRGACVTAEFPLEGVKAAP